MHFTTLALLSLAALVSADYQKSTVLPGTTTTTSSKPTYTPECDDEVDTKPAGGYTKSTVVAPVSTVVAGYGGDLPATTVSPVKKATQSNLYQSGAGANVAGGFVAAAVGVAALFV
ncbi:hypothetical protein BC829DRAFT_401665 [Chytridium lagenaria]|nr:hypothetical protein BC829DRAFT_401665 [Chytridium lagenaria]